MSYNNIKVIEAQSLEERIESKLSYMDRNGVDHVNIEAVTTRPEGSHLLKEWRFGSNIVTVAGNVYYAQQGAGGGTITNDFAGTNGRCELRQAVISPTSAHHYGSTTFLSATRKGHSTGYPKANDLDADNTGKGTSVTTYKFEWGTADFNLTGLNGGCIHAGATAPSGTEPLLTHWSFSPAFDKTSSDTLKVYVNHTFTGT